jgi:hypothetical protein
VEELNVDRELALKALKVTIRYIDEQDVGGVPEDTLVRATEDDFALMKMAGDPKAMAVKVHDFRMLRQIQREMGIKCTTGFQCQ